MKTIKREELAVGQLMATRVRKVKGEKYLLEVAEKFARPAAVVNAAAFFNEGDERFKPSSDNVRLGWISGTETSFKKIGISLDKVTEDWTPVNGLLEVTDANGATLRLLIKDYQTPTDNDKTDIKKYAKNTGNKENPLYFVHKKALVFSTTTLAFIPKGQEPHNTIISIKDENGNLKADCALLPYDEAIAFCKDEVVSTTKETAVGVL